MKRCFLFDPLTGEFISDYLAQASPEEPGEFLVPTHSTFVEPPQIDQHQVATFAGGQWAVQPDYRGRTWYDAQGNEVVIEAIGAPDATLSPSLPESQQLIIAQSRQLASLAVAHSAAIQRPVPYLGTLFQADDASQIVLTKVLVAGVVPDGFFWLDASNAPVTMTFAQLQGLAAAMLTQGQAAFAKLQQLKSAVREAVTVDAVAAVVWQ